jgi:hypothetical protein
MRDDLVRRTVKRVARWHFGVNLYVIRAWRRARGERPHVLGGGCRRSGGCCESPTITVGRLLWSLAARALVFGCTHFDRETRSCDSYDSRPGMCRDYPRLLLWQPNPELLPGCGFRAIASNAEGLREALDRLDLTPEQREKLRKGLRLDAD